MHLKYGNYVNDLSKARVKIQRQPIYSAFGEAVAVRETWEIEKPLTAQGERTHPMKLTWNWKLSSQSWLAVGKGALIAAAAAFLTFVAGNIGLLDFGPYTPFVASLLAVVVNYLRKALTEPAAPL